MGFAFAHLITGWILGRIWEFSGKRKLDHVAWFCILFGAILPDMDLLLDWTIKLHTHRAITHSFLFAILVGVLGYAVVTFLKMYVWKDSNGSKTKQIIGLLDPKIIGISLALGITSHFLLDMITGSDGVPLLWPLMYYFGNSGVYLREGLANGFSQASYNIYQAIFDMGLGTLWILWFTLRGRFKP